jgi:hypothetical protein
LPEGDLVIVAFLMLLAGVWLGILLLALFCLVLAKVLKNKWNQEFFSAYFHAYRFLLTFGIWK